MCCYTWEIGANSVSTIAGRYDLSFIIFNMSLTQFFRLCITFVLHLVSTIKFPLPKLNIFFLSKSDSSNTFFATSTTRPHLHSNLFFTKVFFFFFGPSLFYFIFLFLVSPSLINFFIFLTLYLCLIVLFWCCFPVLFVVS